MVTKKNTTVSDVTPCSLVEVYKHFGESYCLQASYKQNTENPPTISVGKPEGKRPLGRPRHRWVDNIKVDLR
jgi:hypothetical protein